MPSKLDQLRSMTTVVADTGDLASVRRLRPEDCTTNPTLLLKAAQHPESDALVADAVSWGRRQSGAREAVTAAVADRIAVAVGAELAGIVPGRVSTEVDADLSFDAAATVATAHRIIDAYRALGIGRERILIKVAGTWEGIEATRRLQAEGIDCNVTLVFSAVQAMAAAEAGAFLISPFVGRILDWHVKAGGGPYTAETDPGVESVRGIYAAFKAHGAKTVVMGASFRNAGEVEALAGCDRLTVSPALLDALAADEGDLPRRLRAGAPGPHPAWRRDDERSFRFALNEDAMATEKLSEGIRQFVRDLRQLRAIVGLKLDEAAAS